MLLPMKPRPIRVPALQLLAAALWALMLIGCGGAPQRPTTPPRAAKAGVAASSATRPTSLPRAFRATAGECLDAFATRLLAMGAIELTVDVKGRVSAGGRQLASKAELKQLLLRCHQQDREGKTPLVIRAAARTAFGAVVRVLDVAKAAGLRKITFAAAR
jgi:biopolymer transport protein ExbD